jgi:hypothetical protein
VANVRDFVMLKVLANLVGQKEMSADGVNASETDLEVELNRLVCLQVVAGQRNHPSA